MGSASQDFRNKPRGEVVARTGGVHGLNSAGRQRKRLLPVFKEAALAAKLNNHIPNPIAEEYIRHLLRPVLSGVVAGFILVGCNIIDQREGFPQIFQF